MSIIHPLPSHASRWRLKCLRVAALGLSAALLSVISLAAYAQDPVPGSLHTTPLPAFAAGTGKITNIAIGPSTGIPTGIGLQADGKVILSGYCFNGSNFDFCAARLTVDGTLDPSFVGPSGDGNGKFLVPIGTSDDVAATVALQPDGKIVLAGNCLNGTRYDFCVARLKPDGRLDESLVGPNGTGSGKFLLSIGAIEDFVTAVAVQPDGKIVLAGSCGISSNFRFCVVRLSPDGTFDTTFGGPTGNGKIILPTIVGDSTLSAIALQSDGKIVLAGKCYSGGNFNFCVARLNPDGTVDSSFIGPTGVGNGIFELMMVIGVDQATGVALQPDGKIVIAGFCDTSNYDFCVVRLNADGSLDPSFDGPLGNGNGKFLMQIGEGNDHANAIVLQPDGKIVLAGYCANGSTDDFCLARLHTDGTFDSSFDGPNGNGNGKFLLAMGTGDNAATAVALQPDGKIVVAGACSARFCVARLNGGPFGAKNCSFDVDGDGKVLATTDMLIATRVALGITGNAVINGITFAPSAPRQTWPDIRNYLVTQCGMSVAP